MRFDAEKWDFPGWPDCEEFERAPLEEKRELQERLLIKAVRRAWDNIPMLRRKYEAAGVYPEDIRISADLQKLPFVFKDDLTVSLEEYPPFGDYGGNYEIMRLQSTTGSTGKPTPLFYTRRDWEVYGNLMSRRFNQMGVKRGDIVQVCLTYSLFIAGFGMTEGAQKSGAMLIPAGSGAVTPSQRQLEIARDWGTTVIVSTPSYMLHLGELATAAGMDPKKDFKVRIAAVTAEALTPDVKERLENQWGCKVYNVYGSGEMPCIAGDCQEFSGMHINDDAYFCELVAPKTKEPVPEGEEGVLVMTALFKEASQLVRWYTGDIVQITSERCACGRTLPRLVEIRGRADDMVKVRGVLFYPTSVEAVITKFPALGSEYLIEIDKKGNMDTCKVTFEYIEAKTGDLSTLLGKVREALWGKLNFKSDVELVPFGELGKKLGVETRVKSAKKRVLDYRVSS